MYNPIPPPPIKETQYKQIANKKKPKNGVLDASLAVEKTSDSNLIGKWEGCAYLLVSEVIINRFETSSNHV